MAYGFQRDFDINGGSGNVKFGHCWWASKNPFTYKDTSGQDNDPNPYFGYTVVPYVSRFSHSTYYDVRLCMLNASFGVEEDDYLVEYYTNKYSYFPHVIWIKWDVFLVLHCTRSVGLRRTAYKYNGGGSFTQIASPATIYTHTGGSDLSDWFVVRKDVNGCLHILYPYRGGSTKMVYIYWRQAGYGDNEYDSSYWSTSYFKTGYYFHSGATLSFGGLSQRTFTCWMEIVNDTLILAGISMQSSNRNYLKVVHKSLATAYNSWPSSWTIATSELPDEASNSSYKWRNLGVGNSVIIDRWNGSVPADDKRSLMLTHNKLYATTNYYAPFVINVNLNNEGEPLNYDWSGENLGYMLDSTSGVNSGPLVDDGYNSRSMGTFPIHPMGWVMLYEDRASGNYTNARMLNAIRFSWGDNDDDNDSGANQDPTIVRHDAVAYSGGIQDNPMLMIEAGAGGSREVEHLIHDVSSWNDFNQQHSTPSVATHGTPDSGYTSVHPQSGSLFADHPHAPSGVHLGKMNQPFLWSARNIHSTSTRYLRGADLMSEVQYTSHGTGTEYMDDEVLPCIDRERTYAARGAAVLTVVDHDPDNINWTNDNSTTTSMDQTLDGVGYTKASQATMSTTNHQCPAYGRIIAWTDGNYPGDNDFNYCLDLFSQESGVGSLDFGDVLGDTGMIPLPDQARFRHNISWFNSIPNGTNITLIAMFYDGRRLPMMCPPSYAQNGNNESMYMRKFTTSI